MLRGELELVRWFAERLGCDPVRIPIGIGDDMAAVQLDGSLVAITSDMLLDGVHFDTREHSFDLIGRKAIACSLSDCAAMGCWPRAATVSLALPTGIQMADVQQLYEGMERIAAEFDCSIVGGDTTSWKGALAIDVAMIAEPIATRGPIRRSTAQPGDCVYVSGPLGGSLPGRHLTFTPRLELARRLASEPGLHAMMDISDGLSLDLHRLCVASACSAELEAAALEQVIHPDARRAAREDGRPALDHALSDGEDFELLVVGDADLSRAIPELVAVGRICPSQGRPAGELQLVHPDGRREPLAPRGYEHFT